MALKIDNTCIDVDTYPPINQTNMFVAQNYVLQVILMLCKKYVKLVKPIILWFTKNVFFFLLKSSFFVINCDLKFAYEATMIRSLKLIQFEL